MGVSSFIEESPNQALSNLIGYLSLACWIVVMFPQIYLNYKRKSGEGVSLAMMVAWVFGDIFNIVGALMQDLVLSTIIIGAYYLFVDSTLLSQTIYYRVVYKAHMAVKASNGEEDGRLLQQQTDDNNANVLVAGTHEQHEPDLLDCQASNGGSDNQRMELPAQESSAWYSKCQLSDIVGVVLSLVSVGCLAIMIYALVVVPDNADDGSGNGNGNDAASSRLASKQIVAQAMGTASAIVYIMSYVPQALQNHRRKSCEGLSIWLFLLSLMGNTTYALAILVVSLDPLYLAPYVPWLLGALVPCLVHIVILYQFKIYKH
ncbi:putative vacuolar membrane transporter for cationic amino acids [Coemansia sp. RSA 1722]|nr:putative vacuolar membrane transporter for cationic amino acids [Coemansia sp. RSA 486]KAJ2237003.1 putative vacuolar membrane transporter for cationic amino acids [Coemansia sp. RSA 485]KAJ2595704.1 putative vacuolar membrane transporter for cationic amino acids [Coemansia sp. RSA 1721]KAJ2602879.1 putative vacuolar membrane transporter for cationic amino acids [Coemansia sp. RSA 1722]KAJ2635027.1 putative vacuolar membrane transporter for cationic amino acids [Coemansia sp. RSA 1286]